MTKSNLKKQFHFSVQFHKIRAALVGSWLMTFLPHQEAERASRKWGKAIIPQNPLPNGVIPHPTRLQIPKSLASPNRDTNWKPHV